MRTHTSLLAAYSGGALHCDPEMEPQEWPAQTMRGLQARRQSRPTHASISAIEKWADNTTLAAAHTEYPLGSPAVPVVLGRKSTAVRVPQSAMPSAKGPSALCGGRRGALSVSGGTGLRLTVRTRPL